MTDTIVQAPTALRFTLARTAVHAPPEPAPPTSNWPASLPCTQTTRDLIAVRDVGVDGGRMLRPITAGKAGFNDTAIEKTGKWLRKNIATDDGIGVMLTAGTIGAFVTGLIAGCGFETTFLKGLAVAGGTAAVFTSPMMLAGACSALGCIGRKQRNAVLIQPTDVAVPASWYDNANGSEKVAIGQMLSGWLHDFKAKRSIEPETGAELQRVVDDLTRIPEADRARVTELKRLLTVVAEKGEVTGKTTDEFKKIIDAFPETERADLAQAIFALVKESGREVDYDAKHALFALAAQYKNAPKQESAE